MGSQHSVSVHSHRASRVCSGRGPGPPGGAWLQWTLTKCLQSATRRVTRWTLGQSLQSRPSFDPHCFCREALQALWDRRGRWPGGTSGLSPVLASWAQVPTQGQPGLVGAGVEHAAGGDKLREGMSCKEGQSSGGDELEEETLYRRRRAAGRDIQGYGWWLWAQRLRLCFQKFLDLAQVLGWSRRAR